MTKKEIKLLIQLLIKANEECAKCEGIPATYFLTRGAGGEQEEAEKLIEKFKLENSQI